VGYGVIGRRVVERALNRSFRNVLVHDPLVDDPPEFSPDVPFVSRDELITSSDIVSLHADLNPSTRGMIDSNFLGTLSENSYLINTARGGMVDLSALSRALGSGRLEGAALDVFPEEPPEGGRLDDLPGLLTTPHSAGFHPDLLEDLRSEVLEILVNYRENGSVESPVTPRSVEERRRLEPGKPT
jgi:D-3-phosphoglycerate dehydrogenase